MPCTKEQLIAAINSYAIARSTSDDLLTQMAAKALAQLIDSLVFTQSQAPEDDGSQE